MKTYKENKKEYEESLAEDNRLLKAEVKKKLESIICKDKNKCDFEIIDTIEEKVLGWDSYIYEHYQCKKCGFITIETIQVPN